MGEFSLHSKNKLRKTVDWFLPMIGLTILFFAVVSFISPSFASNAIPTADCVQQEKIQSKFPGITDFKSPSIVGLEVEEVKESKEERDHNSNPFFKFCSPACITAIERIFLKENFLAENRSISKRKIGLYLLFQNLRIPLS